MKGVEMKKELSPKQREELLTALKARFEKNMIRYKGLDWAKVRARLEADTEKLWSLNEMEGTGGEPDVVGHDKKTNEYIFFDCSAETPKGRTSVCYDREGLESRKEHRPKNTAMDMAAAMALPAAIALPDAAAAGAEDTPISPAATFAADTSTTAFGASASGAAGFTPTTATAAGAGIPASTVT